MIKNKSAYTFEKKGVYDKILIDGDLIAFACAAASDGHYYAVVEKDAEGVSFEVFRCRYKKELDEFISTYKGDYYVYDDYEPENIDTCLHSVKLMTSSIIETVGGGDYQIFLTGSNNFRYDVNPQYKANRKEVRRPFHLDNCRTYLIERFGAKVTDGYEADDALGINQTSNTIICSTDKDLNSIPGWHYNWNKQEIYQISEQDALLNLYSQILVGDRTDNIFGIDGVGKKTADALIKGSNLSSEKDLYDFVVSVYASYETLPCVDFDTFMCEVERKVDLVAKQVFILRRKGELWKSPKELTDS